MRVQLHLHRHREPHIARIDGVQQRVVMSVTPFTTIEALTLAQLVRLGQAALTQAVAQHRSALQLHPHCEKFRALANSVKAIAQWAAVVGIKPRICHVALKETREYKPD